MFVTKLGNDLEQSLKSVIAIGDVSSITGVMASVSERYEVLKKVHTRVKNRVNKLFIFLGVDSTKYKVMQ